MSDSRERLTQALDNPRFQELGYRDQQRIRSQLLSVARKHDRAYRALPQEERQAFEQEYMTQLPTSILKADAQEHLTPAEQEAVYRARAAYDAKMTGRSSLGFMDGWLDQVASAQSIVGKTARRISEVLTGIDMREVFTNSPLMQDAQLYQYSVENAVAPEGLKDYRLGRNIVRGLNGVGEMAMMGSLYGSIGAEGYLTKWIPRAVKSMGLSSKAINLGARATRVLDALKISASARTIAQAGLQAATETLGYVGEDLILDLFDDRFSEEGAWGQWAEEIPSDMLRGFGFFAMGELAGGLMGRAVRSARKGITGLSLEQKARYFNKISSDETFEQIRKVVFLEDEQAYKALRNTFEGDEEALSMIERTKRRMETYQKLGAQLYDDDVATRLLAEDAFDLKIEDNVVKQIGKNKVNIPFKSSDELIAGLRTEFKKATNDALSVSAKNSAAEGSKVTLSVAVEGKVKSVSVSANKIVTDGLDKVGNVNRNHFETMVKAIDDKLNVKQVANFDAAVRQEGEIVIPERINTKAKEEMTGFVKSIKDQLEFNGVKSKSNKFDITDYVDKLRYNSDWTMPEIDALDSVSWVRPASKSGTITARFKDGSQITGTLSQVGEYSHFKSMDLPTINRRLSRDFGQMIQLNKNNGYDLLDDGKVIKSYGTLKDLWYDNFATMPRRFDDNFTKFLHVDNRKDFFVAPQTTGGDIKKLTAKLAQFESSWENAIAKEKTFRRVGTNGASIEVVPERRLYRVQLGESGLTKVFDNVKDAQKFLRKDMTSFRNYKEELLDKFHLEIAALPHGGYQITGNTLDNAHYFLKLEDAKKFVAGIENDLLAKQANMSGLSDFEEVEIVESLQKEFKDFQPEINKIRRAWNKATQSTSMGKFITNYTSSTNRLVERLDIPELSLSYQRYMGRSKLFDSHYNQISRPYKSRISGFSTAERMEMGQILMQELDSREWTNVAKALGIDTSKPRWDDMVSMMDYTRSYLNDLGVRFGITLEMWQKNYLPRMKNIEIADARSAVDDIDFVRNIMDPEHKMPELDAFFEHTRKTDMISAKLNPNIDNVVDIYTRIGLRKQYLGHALTDFEDVISKLVNTERITGTTGTRLRTFSNATTGRFTGEAAANQYKNRMEWVHKWAVQKGWTGDLEGLENLSPREMKRIEKILNADISRGLSTLQTGALMSFKVWMPIRNVAQVNHMGAVYGNATVLRAMEKVLANPVKAYDEALAKGFLQGRNAMERTHFLSWLENINTVGLNWFKNSDDYTRIVGMYATELAFDEALVGLKMGRGDVKRFMRRTFAKALDEGSQREFVRMMSENNIDGAKQMLQRNLIDWTFFNYSKAQKSALAHGAIGRILLSYSTYPQQFLEMTGRMLQNDPLMAGRLVGNMAIISAIYGDVLGLEGYEGNPLKTVVFMGGPMFSVGMDAVRTATKGFSNVARMDTDLITKGQRIGKLGLEIVNDVGRITVPFNWYPKRALEGVSALDSGEYYVSLLNFAGLNVNADAVVPNMSMDTFVKNFYDDL